MLVRLFKPLGTRWLVQATPESVVAIMTPLLVSKLLPTASHVVAEAHEILLRPPTLLGTLWLVQVTPELVVAIWPHRDARIWPLWAITDSRVSRSAKVAVN